MHVFIHTHMCASKRRRTNGHTLSCLPHLHAHDGSLQAVVRGGGLAPCFEDGEEAREPVGFPFNVGVSELSTTSAIFGWHWNACCPNLRAAVVSGAGELRLEDVRALVGADTSSATALPSAVAEVGGRGEPPDHTCTHPSCGIASRQNCCYAADWRGAPWQRHSRVVEDGERAARLSGIP